MNQTVFVLYSGAIQVQAKRDLKLTKLSIISPYLAKFMKHNKSTTTFLHQAVIFSAIYLSKATSVTYLI